MSGRRFAPHVTCTTHLHLCSQTLGEFITSYSKAAIVRFLHEFFDQAFDETSEDASPNDQSRDLFRQLAKRFPKARKEHLEAAWKDYQFEREVERQADEEALADLEMMLTFLAKHNIPENTPYGAAVRAVAATGDPEARALANDLERPAGRVFIALLAAAVDAHPYWSRDGEHRFWPHGEGAPSTPEALVDWFQVTYPRRAREIEDRIAADLG